MKALWPIYAYDTAVEGLCYRHVEKTRGLRPRLRKIEQHEVYISSPGIWIRTLNEHESWRPSASASRNNQKRWWESDASAAWRHLTPLATSGAQDLFFLYRATEKFRVDNAGAKRERRELKRLKSKEIFIWYFLRNYESVAPSRWVIEEKKVGWRLKAE